MDASARARALTRRALDALVASAEWVTHMTRESLHLEGAGAVRGVTGAAVMERMQLWTATIPK